MDKVFFFDLDSTLLQMDQDEFLKGYFSLVGSYAKSLGYDPKEFMDSFNRGAYAIIKNDGKVTNRECFWNYIGLKYPDTVKLEEEFDLFYKNEFKALESYVRRTDTPRLLIKYLKDKGYTLILATNPVFPLHATMERIRWSSIDPDSFSLITSYENSRYCKPNPLYFKDILDQLHLEPSQCIMVGNDIDDDFGGLPSGFTRYMIQDYMLNRKNREIDVPLYGMDEFYEFVKKTY